MDHKLIEFCRENAESVTSFEASIYRLENGTAEYLTRVFLHEEGKYQQHQVDSETLREALGLVFATTDRKE